MKINKIVYAILSLLKILVCYAARYDMPERANVNSFPSNKDADCIRVISYNIRLDYKIDVINNNAWDRRKQKIIKILEHYDPDIIGLQETSTLNLNDLKDLLPSYEIVNNVSKQFKSNLDVLLLYKKGRFELIDSSWFWLSEKEVNLNKLKQLEIPRITLWMKLHDKQTGKEFFVYTAHFNSNSSKTRLESAEVLSKQEKRISRIFPSIVMGDFNTFKQSDEMVYEQFISNTKLIDVRDTSAIHFGPDGTWIGWPYDKFAVPPHTVGKRFDHMFVKDIKVLKEGVIRDKVNDNGEILFQAFRNNKLDAVTLYPSDHLAIIADLKLY